MHYNPTITCDGYKLGHRQQYPDNTTLVFSNFTPRSGKYANVTDKSGVIFAGLQYFILEHLIDAWDVEFFRRPKHEVIARYKRRLDNYLGKDAVPIDGMEALHDLGYLPIAINAVNEGDFVPTGVAAMTIYSTNPEFYWLTNYLETVISCYLWLPCTSATTAANYRQLLDKYAELTGSPKAFVDFQAHDFSFRGMSSLQSAMKSGAAHLLFFKGTDTLPAIDLLEDYYGADSDNELVGVSVPASEHAVMSAGGEADELETFRRLILKVYPKGIVSIVSDTWDFFRVITEYAKTLHQEIMSRDGKLVFRPDSGVPEDIICGNAKIVSKVPGTRTMNEFDGYDEIYDASDDYEYVICGDSAYKVEKHFDNQYGETSVWVEIGNPEPIRPEHKGAVQCLWEIFGGTTTETGHKLLDPHVGLIYGDSITYKRASEIMERLHAKGFASANVVLGIGSYTYQLVSRDTWGWAIKATYCVVDGQPRNIFKKPKTDDGTKNSATGLLFVHRDEAGRITTMEQGVSWERFKSSDNALQPVFRDGQLLRRHTLAEIRERVSK